MDLERGVCEGVLGNGSSQCAVYKYSIINYIVHGRPIVSLVKRGRRKDILTGEWKEFGQRLSNHELVIFVSL